LEPNFRYKSFGSNEKLEFKVSEIDDMIELIIDFLMPSI
jgi:hypothetical protein